MVPYSCTCLTENCGGVYIVGLLTSEKKLYDVALSVVTNARKLSFHHRLLIIYA